METPKLDWLFNTLAGNTQDFDILHQANVDFTLADKDKYSAKDKIRELDIFKDNSGNFSQAKFDKFYDNELKRYNKFKQEQFVFNSIYNIDVDDTLAKKNNIQLSPTPINFDVSIDPYMGKESIFQLGVKEKRNFSRHEVSRMQNGYMDSKGNWKDLGEQVSMWNVPLDTVLAIAVDNNGVPKLRDGKFYYEDISGKDPTGKDLFSRLDGITDEGSFLNQYDFLNSNDVEKSVPGQIFKVAAKVLPAFVPYVGQVYTYATLAKEGADAAVQAVKAIDKMTEGMGVDLIDDKKANTIQGFLRQFNSSSSEYAQENPFTSFEGWSNIVGDIVLQLKQQVALGMLPMQVKALANSKNVAAYAAKNGKTTYEILNSAEDLGKVLGESANIYKKLGSELATNYMAATSAMGIVDAAKAAGLDDTETSIMWASTFAAFNALFRTNLGNWALAAAGLEENKAIVDNFLKNYAKQFFKVAQKKGVERQKDILGLGKEIGEKLAGIYNNISKGGLSDLAAAAGAESLEEGSEVLIQESLKTIYNGLSKAGLTRTKSKFNTWGEDFLTELGGSLLAGAVGGGIFKKMQGLPNLADADIIELQQRGYTEALLKGVERLSKSKTGLLPKDLSINFERKDGQIVYKPYDPTNNLDINQNDFVTDLIKQELYKNQLFLNSLKLDEESLKNLDIRYSELFEGKIPKTIGTLIKDDVNRLTKEALVVNNEIKLIDQELGSIDKETAEYELKLKSKKDLESKLDYINKELENIRDLRKSSDYLEFGLFQLKRKDFDVFFDSIPKSKDDIAKAEYQVSYNNLSEDQKIEIDEKYTQQRLKEFNNEKEAYKKYKDFYYKEADSKLRKLKEKYTVDFKNSTFSIDTLDQLGKNYLFYSNLTEKLKKLRPQVKIEEAYLDPDIEFEGEDKVKQQKILSEKAYLDEYIEEDDEEMVFKKGAIDSLLKELDDTFFKPLAEFTADKELLDDLFKADGEFFKRLKTLNDNLETLGVDTTPLLNRMNAKFYQATKDKPILAYASDDFVITNITNEDIKRMNDIAEENGDTRLVYTNLKEDEYHDILYDVDYVDSIIEIPFRDYAINLAVDEDYQNLMQLAQEKPFINPLDIIGKQFEAIKDRINRQVQAANDETIPYASLNNELELQSILNELEKYMVSVTDASELNGRNPIINKFRSSNPEITDKKDPEVLYNIFQENVLKHYLSNLIGQTKILQNFLKEQQDNLTFQIKSKAQKTFVTFHKVLNEVLTENGKNPISIDNYKTLKKVKESLDNGEELVFNNEELAKVYDEMMLIEEAFKQSFTEEEKEGVLDRLFDKVTTETTLNITSNEIKYEPNTPVEFNTYQKYQYIFTVFNTGREFYANLTDAVKAEYAPVFEQELGLRMMQAYFNSKYKNTNYKTNTDELKIKLNLENSIFVNGMPGVGKTLFMQRMVALLNNYSTKYYAPGDSQLENSKEGLAGTNSVEGGTLEDLANDLGITLYTKNVYEEKAGAFGIKEEFLDVETDTKDNFEGVDIIFFDEATNIELKHLHQINEALKKYNEEFRKGKKPLNIVYLGDTEQFGATIDDIDVSIKGYGNVFTIPKLNQAIRINWKQLNNISSQVRNKFKIIEQKDVLEGDELNIEYTYALSIRDRGEFVEDFIGMYVGDNDKIDKIIDKKATEGASLVIIDDVDDNGNFIHAAEIASKYGKDALTHTFTPSKVQGREADYVVVYSSPKNYKGRYAHKRYTEWLNTITSRAKKGVHFKGNLGIFKFKGTKEEVGIRESLFDKSDFLEVFKEERLAAYKAAAGDKEVEKTGTSKKPKINNAGNAKEPEERDIGDIKNKVNRNLYNTFEEILNKTFEGLDLENFQHPDKLKVKRSLVQIVIYKAMIDQGNITGRLSQIYTELFNNSNNKVKGKLSHLVDKLKTGSIVIRNNGEYTYNNEKGKAYVLAIKVGEDYYPVFHIKKEHFDLYPDISNLKPDEEVVLSNDFKDISKYIVVNKAGRIVTPKYKQDNRVKDRKNPNKALTEDKLNTLSSIMPVSKPFVFTGNMVRGKSEFPKYIELGVPYIIVSRNGKAITSSEELETVLDNILKYNSKGEFPDYYLHKFETIQYNNFSEVIEEFKVNKEDQSAGSKIFNLLSLRSKVQLLYNINKQHKKNKTAILQSLRENGYDEVDSFSALAAAFYRKNVEADEYGYSEDYEFDEEAYNIFVDILDRDTFDFTPAEMAALAKGGQSFDFFSFFNALVELDLEEDDLNLLGEGVDLFKGVAFKLSAKKSTNKQTIGSFLDDDSFSSIFDDTVFFNDLDLNANYDKILQDMTGEPEQKFEPEEELTDTDAIVAELENIAGKLNNDSLNDLIKTFKSKPDGMNAAPILAVFEDLKMMTNTSDYDNIINELKKVCE